MAKSSGNTRGSSWRDKQANPNAIDQRTEDIIWLSEQVKNGNFVNWGDGNIDGRVQRIWDGISDKERLAVLESGKFTGMMQGDDLETATFFHESSKDNMVAMVQDALYNVKEGFNVEDENHYAIKIKGRKVVYSEDLTKPLTKAEVRDIEWISGNQGLSENGYWAKDAKAKENMKKTMDYNEFNKGHQTSSVSGKFIADNHYSYEQQFWHD